MLSGKIDWPNNLWKYSKRMSSGTTSLHYSWVCKYVSFIWINLFLSNCLRWCNCQPRLSTSNWCLFWMFWWRHADNVHLLHWWVNFFLFIPIRFNFFYITRCNESVAIAGAGGIIAKNGISMILISMATIFLTFL